jgi:hypothetical protein
MARRTREYGMQNDGSDAPISRVVSPDTVLLEDRGWLAYYFPTHVTMICDASKKQDRMKSFDFGSALG